MIFSGRCEHNYLDIEFFILFMIVNLWRILPFCYLWDLLMSGYPDLD
uniref:Uncharacterized protein n=1 Tax=Rhizophora mucronata TaxID=61149 RepID=A0A2P2PGF0_RHIMU